MNVVDIHDFAEDWVVGPDQGAMRLFIWGISAGKGQMVGLHHHRGEEIFRVLYGRLRFRVGEQIQEVGPGNILIIPPGTEHGYEVLETAELELYGETGCGIFITRRSPDGTIIEDESFVRGYPWSRIPDDEGRYVTRDEQLRRLPAI